MNKFTGIGRLTKDPEIRHTHSGKAVASFTLAIDRKKGKSRREKQTDFIPIVAWEKLAELCGNYLFKGHRVYVEGRLQIRSYETNDGQKRSVTEVVLDDIEFLEKKSASHDNSSGVNSFGKDVFPDEEISF